MRTLRFLPLLAVLFLCASPAKAQIAHVSGQSCGTGGSGVYVLTITCTLTNPIGAGHFLFGCISSQNTMVTGLSWSGDSGTFTSITGLTNANWTSFSGVYTTCVYVPSAGGGGSTITGTLVGDFLNPTIWFDEFTGVGILDQVGSVADNSNTAPTTGNITPSVANELILGIVTISSTVTVSTLTAGGSYTLGGSIKAAAGSTSAGSEYYVDASTSPLNATFTITSAPWAANIISFEPAATASGGGGMGGEAGIGGKAGIG